MATNTKAKQVAIIGAGVAGLVAAYRLSGYGHKVTVLETQPRVGGRAITLRSYFAEELVPQAGPSRFPGDFKRVFTYARKLGLKLTPYYPNSGTVVAYFKGKRIEEYHPSPEEFWGYTALVNRYPGGVEGLALGLALRVRALARRIRGLPPWMTYGISGGTDRFTDALAKAVKGEFRLEATVRSLTQEGNGVLVNFATPEGEGTLTADYVVCATPLSITNRIRFSPPLAPGKVELMKAVRFSSAIRIFLQMKRAYWRDNGHNGFAVTDTLGEIWDPHFDSADAPALLVCYAKDDLADRLGNMGETERLEYVLDELEKVFSGARSHFQKGTSFCWKEQSWVLGGWPLVREKFSNRVKIFREPEGRIYFAGDYAAAPDLLNTMEGTIESGEFVADQINLRP